MIKVDKMNGYCCDWCDGYGDCCDEYGDCCESYCECDEYGDSKNFLMQSAKIIDLSLWTFIKYFIRSIT